MKTVIIESPYKGDIKKNIEYADKCMLDSIKKGESPFLSHLLYTRVLNDRIKEERELGIKCNLSWHNKADLIIFYVDNGITEGMWEALKYTVSIKKNIKIRYLEK